LKRLGLHAYELVIIHPITGKRLDFKAPMPADFKKLFFAKETDKKTKAAPKPTEKPKRAQRESKKVAKIKKKNAKVPFYERGKKR
jgi:hypothetical protein